MPFPGIWIFPRKIREISCPVHSGTSSSRYRLSPKNEMGILEFEIWYFNSRNSVLLGIFLLGTENSNTNKIKQDQGKNFLFGTEICNKNKTNQDHFLKDKVNNPNSL